MCGPPRISQPGLSTVDTDAVEGRSTFRLGMLRPMLRSRHLGSGQGYSRERLGRSSSQARITWMLGLVLMRWLA